MIVRHPRNWLRAARGLVLSAAALSLAQAARAQTAPAPAPPRAQTAPVAPAPAANAPTVPAPAAPAPGTSPPPPAADIGAGPAQPPLVAAPQQPAAVAATEPSAVSPTDAPNAPEDHEKKKKKKGDKEHLAGVGVTTAAGRIQLKGRVFARAELEHQERGFTSVAEDDVFDFSLASARVGLEYEAPLRWISAVAELELSGKPELKDGYVQARGQHFFARMGQFKMPVSELESESPWNLPLARRGFIHDLLTDWLDVGGRRPGVMVGWRGRGGLRPRFMVGAFQGAILSESPSSGDRDTELVEKRALDAQSYIARVQFEPADVQLGAWYEHRLGSRALNQVEHYATAGVDAVFDRVVGTGGIRAWVEGSTGESWYERAAKEQDDKDALYVSGRALVGYRFGGTVDEAVYVEPFGYFGVLDPDTEVTTDMAFEGAVGVNAGYWRRARLTLQAEINKVQRNFPETYLTGVDPNRTGLLLQAGVAW